jgi:hypothetical protein
MTMIGPLLAGLALMVIVLGASQIGGPRCCKYWITDNSIEFVCFGKLRVWRCAFEDISDIRLFSSARALFLLAHNLRNRPFGRCVLVERRRGMLPVIMTPDRPEAFVRIVREKITNRLYRSMFTSRRP